MTACDVLKQYFGYDNFRAGQDMLIDDILAGNDVLGIMPTGAGKSMCFQIPAMMMEGVTLVISPLISLMKDQVDALTQSGVPAAFINSSLTDAQIQRALHNGCDGMYKLIYVAPERLMTNDFINFAVNTNISMIAVDEAHCISQWGQDFRPSYTAIPEFIARLSHRPVVSAFTATATPVVREDILNQLKLNDPKVLVSGFDRPNLYFDVKKPGDKFEALEEFLEDKTGLSGIVYCSTRNTVEEICDRLRGIGFNASRYHAGLSDGERHRNQDDFLHDRAKIMVATNAFGMGIDKSNVSFVVHYNMPKDIEGYYQEAGRAGRDGAPADCLLLHGGRDLATNMWLIDNGGGEHLDYEADRTLKERNIKRLHDMAMYCETSECLRSYILKYFGETPPESCGGCVNCDTDFEIVDITTEAQKIISCVARMRGRFGVKMLIDVLRGKRTANVLKFGLDQLSTFGISDKGAAQLTEIINYLILNDYLYKTADRYPVIKPGQCANHALGADVVMTMKTVKPEEVIRAEVKISTGTRRGRKAKAATAVNVAIDKELLAALKELRHTIAKEQNLPAFVIFHDTSLMDMCMKIPRDYQDFMEVSGVGKVKADRYGRQFLSVIGEFLENNGVPTAMPPSNTSKEFGPSNIEISDEPVTVTVIADRVNCVLLESGLGKTTGQKINDWLICKGHMEAIQQKGKNIKIPTPSGEKLGIKTQERMVRGENIQINIFEAMAQRYVAENVLEIIGRLS